jgi:LPS-assembly lipoprotein
VKQCGYRSFFLITTLLLLTGCGFHLRGNFSIPPALQRLSIQPHQPYDPFQRQLQKILTSNDVHLQERNNKALTTLSILTQDFSERTIAYGADGQPNRAILQYLVTYQILDPQNTINADERRVQVEREITLNPNETLGTDQTRNHLKNDLYLDAAFALTRQLSSL